MAHKQGGGMTTSEILNLLQTDFEFGINFIIDNNPSAVESNISSLSIPLPQNPSNLQLREVIDTLLQDGSDDTAPEKVKEIILVPYLDNATNYTGGLGNEISSLMPEPEINASGGLWVGLISGILTGVTNIWGAYKQEDIMEIQAQMQQDQIKYELEKIERTKILKK